MNTYTQESFQKYERKRSSSKQYEEDGYKTKHKNSYSEQRRVKRNWEQE